MKVSTKINWPKEFKLTWSSQRKLNKTFSNNLKKNLNSQQRKILILIENHCLPKNNQVYFNQEAVIVESPSVLTSQQKNNLNEILTSLMPWRKGPYKLFDIYVDSEWCSNLKWDRFLPHIEDLQDKNILDIGCSNGYFMFKMLEHRPRNVLGLDPTLKFFHTFHFLNSLLPKNNLYFGLGGFQDLKYFGAVFDAIFCMGILYHHSDPVSLLKLVFSNLKKGGHLYLESMTIPGDDPIALFPGKKYNNAKGFWYIPTLSCLENWLKKANIQKYEILYHKPLEVEEQRKTSWATYPSFKESLNPQDNSKTIEGFPAQNRIYLKCYK